MLKFTNTLTGKKEEFVVSDKLLMYVCGVTPYDHAHVGHGRCYVAFDVLYRLLSFLGVAPVYCRNFTDIDDKLLNRAAKEFGDRLRYREIADRYIASFHKDMAALNCLSPAIEPRVTHNIQPIIEFIEQLIASGHAYQAGNDVYFDIERFSDYGKLSKQKIEDLHAGVRVDVREQKKNALDFALWKGEPAGEFWQSPWGYGRPGWHIECSVLARSYLGEHIDIHGGGLDLIFPHHENEIAQSESLFGAPFARCWMHNGFVTVNKEKMSKSLGNFLVLHELFKQYDPMVVRYYFITHHYRAPIEFSTALLDAAQKSYERLVRLFADGDSEKDSDDESCENSRVAVDAVNYDSVIVQRMFEFLYDDLNTPGLLGVLFENIAEIASNERDRMTVREVFVNVLGLTLEALPEKEVVITAEIQDLIDARKHARHEKNWALADELRDKLVALGVDVRDDKI
jgi:cysteinyl-tRNA synthetase